MENISARNPIKVAIENGIKRKIVQKVVKNCESDLLKGYFKLIVSVSFFFVRRGEFANVYFWGKRRQVSSPKFNQIKSREG